MEWQSVLAGIYDSSAVYSLASLALFRRYRFIDQATFLSIILLTTVASTVNLSMSLIPPHARAVTAAVIGVANLLVAVLRSMSEKIDIAGKAGDYRDASSRFTELNNTILFSLYLQSTPAVFVSESTSALNSILGSTPDIGASSLRKIVDSRAADSLGTLELPSALRDVGVKVPMPSAEVLLPPTSRPAVSVIKAETVPVLCGSTLHWDGKCEYLLALYAERFQVYVRLYGQAFRRMQSIGYCLSMPSIVLSTIAGTGNFALSSVSGETTKGVATLALGLMSSSTIVISSIESYFQIPARRESYNLARARYDSMARRIVAELSLQRDLRMSDGGSMLRDAFKLEGSLQMETPPLPADILASFSPLPTHHVPVGVRLDSFRPIFDAFSAEELRDSGATAALDQMIRTMKQAREEEKLAADDLFRKTDQDRAFHLMSLSMDSLRQRLDVSEMELVLAQEDREKLILLNRESERQCQLLRKRSSPKHWK